MAAGLILMLSMAVAPVSARPAQQLEFSICPFLFSAAQHLPDVPGLRSAFALLFSEFGCED
jgi:hypothetical protein